MPEDQAEILASERSHLVESELVTRTYLDLRLERLETKLEKSFKADIHDLQKDMKLVKWMLAPVMVVNVIPFLQQLL